MALIKSQKCRKLESKRLNDSPGKNASAIENFPKAVADQILHELPLRKPGKNNQSSS